LNAPCQFSIYIVVGLCVAINCTSIFSSLASAIRCHSCCKICSVNLILIVLLLLGTFSCIRVVVCFFGLEGEFGIGLLCFVVLGI
jgi:hypothetical protein